MFTESIVNNASGAVALLFRKIIIDNKLSNQFKNLIDVYADNNSKDSQEKSKIKTNYTTHFNSGELTIKIFNMLFRDILKVKSITYTLDVKYGEETYTASYCDELKSKDTETVSELYKSIAKQGLNKDLDNKLEAFAKARTDTSTEKNKEMYNRLHQINSKKMSFKTLVFILNNVFNCEFLVLTAVIKHGKNTLSSTVKINL